MKVSSTDLPVELIEDLWLWLVPAIPDRWLEEEKIWRQEFNPDRLPDTSLQTCPKCSSSDKHVEGWYSRGDDSFRCHECELELPGQEYSELLDKFNRTKEISSSKQARIEAALRGFQPGLNR